MTPLVGIGNILILDRTPDALAVAQLQAYGGCVLTASDAASAESLIRRQPPDLILLDTSFAEAEDADFVQSLFAEPDLASVILLTPQADAEHVFQALAAGYVDCVSRPLHSVDTLARIVSHLRRGKKQRQLALDNSRLAQRLAAETAALTAQQRSFQTLAEGLPDNIARYDLGSRLVYLNPQLLRTLGVAAQDLLGKTPQEAFPGSEFAAYQACIEAALATGQDTALELAMPDSDGKIHHLIRFVVERGAAGEVVGVLAIGRDVSERKNAERQLEILDRAVEASSEATFLMDGQGRFVYVNGAACRSLGYSRDELLTMSPLDIDPDITPEAFAALLQAMFTGNHPGGPVESRHQARDGRTFPVEMYGSVIEYDQAQFCLVMARDISERKAAEAQLHRSEQMFRAMVENSPDAIARYDSQCRRIFVNRATQLMYGQSAEQLLGRTPSECSALVNAEGFTQAIREVFARGVEGLREVVFTNADGQT
jgi:PAS domain S-box-containing protein